jgi:hypothetical protein
LLSLIAGKRVGIRFSLALWHGQKSSCSFAKHQPAAFFATAFVWTAFSASGASP